MKKNIFIISLLTILVPSSFGIITQENQYKKAKTEKDVTAMKILYEQAYAEDNDSIFGQLSLMELAKYNFFKRDYINAVSLLKKVYHKKITNKQYWLARSFLKMGKYQLSIISSQIFIAESDDNVKIENAYFLISESYLLQKMYKRAFNTLESLRTSKYINNNIPLLHYKMGVCKEQEEKFEQALMFYKKLKQDFPYHQYCYLAEDRIYNLKKADKLEIDLSEINTFRKEKSVEETKAATGKDLKIYLQVGAFGSEDRAEKLGKRVKVIGYKYIVFSKIKNNSKLYVVAAGPFDENDNLKKAMQKLKKNDIDSYVIKRY
ncbi:MAG: SPOR domain-containing protein [Candidatus Tenebribacter burtonii]|jgi:TolA-binding protein|nr:SPOR domain-containing protein [Candidatus Tenebribacter burtonii]